MENKKQGKKLFKKIASAALAALISAVSVIGIAGSSLAGTEEGTVVYVTIADAGTLETTNEKIVLQGKADGKYNVDDALYAVHELFYEGGASAGYSAGKTDYGYSLLKLWGDESLMFGYMNNNVMCWNMTDDIADGDRIYAYIYADPFCSDKYTFFDKTAYDGTKGTAVDVVLKYYEYDENWSLQEKTLEGAAITCINDETALASVVTDSDGKAALTFTKEGVFKITAEKEGEVLVPPAATVYVGSGQKEAEPEKTVNVTRPGQEKADAYEYGNEWAIILEQRQGILTAENALKYYNSIVKVLDEKKSAQLDRSRGTENSRVILGLTAAGFDATDVNGYNLLAPLADYDFAIKQGANGVMYALLAINCHNYTIPKAAEGKTQTTEENLIGYLLDNMTGAGWAYSGETPDVDMTAIAVYALAPYAEENEKVTEAVEGALSWLSENQTAQGGYKESFTGKENSCSASEVILALSTLGISSMNDPNFIKNNISLHNALNLYRNADGYKYLADDEEALDYATSSAKRALIAYDRMVNEKSAYFDFNDITLKVGPKSEVPKTADTNAFVLWFMVFSGIAVLLASGAANISDWKKEK